MDSFLEGLYDRFLLRDVLGKVAPGLTLLLVLFVHLFPEQWHHILKHKGFISVALFFSFSYTIGLVLEFIGTRSGLVRTYVVEGDRHKSLRQYSGFLRQRARSEHALLRIFSHRERFVVLKQVSGNFGITLMFILAIKLIALFCFPVHFFANDLLLLLLILLLAVMLLFLSRQFAEEQNIWETLR